jgi:hypothetical protein
MTFGIEKCKTLRTVKRKLELRNFTTEEEDTMTAMTEEDMYKYLGHMQTEQIKHAQMKQQLGDEYIQHTKSILKTKLNGKNTIKAVNTYAISVLTLSFGIVKWTPTDLENLQIKTTALLTRCRIHRPRAAKDRLTLPRHIGRGMADITRLHDKEVNLLQTYFLNKQTSSPLHAAVVKQTINTHYWIYYVQMKVNSPQTKNAKTKSEDSGPKILTRPTPARP